MDGSKQNINTLEDTTSVYYITKETKIGQKQTRTSPRREKGKHLEDTSLERQGSGLWLTETATWAGSPHGPFVAPT